MKEAKILVVEDESVIAWHVQEALHKLGHHVVAIARTAREAIQLAAAKKPDLVLMDICLQDQSDGVSAAEHLYLNLDLPVVYLTAHSDEQTLHRATETSPFGYLVKPFQEAELHSTIQIALRRHQLEKALKETQQWYATTLVSIGDATIATDVDGFIAFMNPAAEYLTGWTQEQALGEFAGRVLDLIHEDTREAIDNPILAALCQGDTVTLPERAMLRARDGVERPVGDSASPIRNRMGEIIGGVMVFQDLSDRRQAERLLKEHNQRLEHVQSYLAAQLRECTLQVQQTISCTQLLKRVFESLHQSPKRLFGSKQSASLRDLPTPLETQHLLQLILEEVGKTLNADYCWASLHDASSTSSTIVCEYYRHPTEPRFLRKFTRQSAMGTRIEIEKFSQFYLRLFQRDYWISPPLEVLPPSYQTWIEATAQLMVCPIQDEQRVIGELGIVTRSQSVWSKLQAELITQVVSQATIALRQAQRYEVAQSQMDELHLLNTLKDDLLQALSRELRMPLSNMRMAIEMLQQLVQTLKVSGEADSRSHPPFLWKKFEHYLRILQQECQEEFSLVNDLLNFQDSEAAAKTPMLHEVKLQEWLPQVIERFCSQAKKSLPRIMVDMAHELPVVSMHEPTLERIFLHLLSHVCKQTPLHQSVQVTASIQGNQLHLATISLGTKPLLIDLPQGVELPDRQSLNRRSFSDASGNGASSLGLTLARTLAIELEGDIQVEARSEKLYLTLVLPLQEKR